MAATRLSEGQKAELVDRFRSGASTAELAKAYGCSPNTVSRTVRAALDPQEYERLKRRRGRTGGGAEPAPAPEAPPQSSAPRAAVADGSTEEASSTDAVDLEVDDVPSRSLAIDDADDFSADDEEEDLLDDDESIESFTTIPVMAPAAERDAVAATPLREARLPASAYMLVDKTVELQARPLKEFPELGTLAREEVDRQALTVYLNPRQAKRQCGRSQRVIKLPDLRLLERTAPYLLAQGISRVVIEGSLYSLPGS